jgi:hypothetical protein
MVPTYFHLPFKQTLKQPQNAPLDAEYVFFGGDDRFTQSCTAYGTPTALLAPHKTHQNLKYSTQTNKHNTLYLNSNTVNNQ